MRGEKREREGERERERERGGGGERERERYSARLAGKFVSSSNFCLIVIVSQI